MTLSSSLAAAANHLASAAGKPRPAPPPNIPPTMQQVAGQTSKRFKSNISVEFKGKSTTSLRDRMTTLYAVLLQADKSIQLHPFDPTSNAATISSTAEIPPTDVSAYVSKGKELKNGTKHHVLMSSNLRLSAIKTHTTVMAHLSKREIWLRPHSISSHDITNIGFIFRKNCDGHSRHDIHAEMVTALGGKFREFQLVARFPFYSEGITTRAWMLQMDKQDSDKWLETMLKVFPLQTNEVGIQLVPFISAANDKDKSMLKIFLFQNKWLQEQSVIRVDNLRGLDEVLTETAPPLHTTTIRSYFMNLKVADTDDEKLFLSVSQYNSGRVTFIVKQKHHHEALEHIDEMVDSYINNQLEPASRAAITFPNRAPVRIGRSKIPQVIEPVLQQVSTLYLPSFEIDLNDDDAISAWSNHRAGSASYASVAATATSSLDSTQSTPASKPTQHLPAKRSVDSAQSEKQAEIDRLLSSLQSKNTELETSQGKLDQAVTDLQASTAQTLQELHRINTATTKIHETLAAHSGQMTTYGDLLSELMAGMNEIRTRLGTDLSSPPRKQSRTSASTDMDGLLPDATGFELSQRFQAQARFTAPPASQLPCPPIPEETSGAPQISPTDGNESDDLYSEQPFPSPAKPQPPDPRHARQTE